MIDFVKSLLTDFDPAKIFPDLSKFFGAMELILRIAVLVGPLCLLGFGLWYLLAATKEANHSVGYRFYWGMSSVEVWQFTQRLAGWLFTVAGLLMTVVIFAVSVSFPQMQLTDMVWRAASCLVVELVVSVLLLLIVNLSAAFRFDRKGRHRRKRR